MTATGGKILWWGEAPRWAVMGWRRAIAREGDGMGEGQNAWDFFDVFSFS